MEKIHRTVQKKKKDLNDLDNLDSVVTHPEPDHLEREIKWTIGSTSVKKASGGTEFQES